MKNIIERIKRAVKRFICFVNQNRVEKVLTTVLNTIARVLDYIPGGPVFLLVSLVNIYCLANATSILLEATIAGIAISISLAVLYIGAPKKVREFILRNSGRATWILDVVMTLALTLIGFCLNATMGNVMLFIGLNASAMLALVKYLGRINGHGLPLGVLEDDVVIQDGRFYREIPLGEGVSILDPVF